VTLKPQAWPFHSSNYQIGLGREFRNPDPMKFPIFRRFTRVFTILVVIATSASQSSPALAASQWGWPIEPAHLSAGLDRPSKNWLPGHRGVDLVGRSGDLVFAAGNGEVTFAGEVASKGVVVIRHGAIRTTYEPVTALVAVGSKVRVGDVIGTLSPGESHCSTQTSVSCLHWGLIRGETYLNPLLLVKKRVRLLPKI
jgi:murein DD-endopeptidase MepM/ murein hydrolase activator NlpD